MSDETVKLVLNIEKSKKQAFVEMLKLFDFVSVDALDTFLERFIKNAPKDVPLTEEEIAEIVTQLRYKR